MALTFSEDSDKIIIDNPANRFSLLIPAILFPIVALGGYAGWVSQGSHTDYVALLGLGLVSIVELVIIWLFFTVTSDTTTFDKMQRTVTIEQKGLRSTTHIIKSFGDISQLKTETKRVSGGRGSTLAVALTLYFTDGTTRLIAVMFASMDYLGKPAPQLGQYIAESLNIPFVQGEIAK